MTLAAGGLSAQQVLMAPQVEMGFEEMQVREQDDTTQVGYELDQNEWNWASDFGLDLWLALYTPGAEQGWQLQRAAPLAGPQGQVSFPADIHAGAAELGLCVVAASEGGKLAPGMGYVCDRPVVVPATEPTLQWQDSDVRVGLRFERQVDEQPWYTAARGFDRAQAAEDVTETTGGFVVYRAPQPPRAVGGAAETMAQPRVDERYDRDRYRDEWNEERRRRRERSERYLDPYAFYDALLYPGPAVPRVFLRPNPFTFDRFRQRRLLERRFFGPLDTFDAKFSRDMFSPHPEDVFYQFRLPPGYFGRDVFGRDLQRGFGAPGGVVPAPGPHGLGQPFE